MTARERCRGWSVLLLVLAMLAGCAAGPGDRSAGTVDPEFRRLAERAARVTILRDDFGVAHVRAATDADAVFGFLYAQAEDDFPRIARNYAWAIGRLAELEGERALMSDLRARLYMTRAEAQAHYAAAPPWLRALCDAFADGLNWYLATHPEVDPGPIRRYEPWMPMYFFEGSIGGDIEQVPLAGIEAFYARGEAADPAALAAALDPHRGFDDPTGSNGIAVAPHRTRDGDTLLLINPHTSFYFRGEYHVTSEEGLDAYGAATWGQFFIYQGFNEKTGWMHTSTYVDFMDDFALEVAERDGALVYRHGDVWRPLWSEPVTLAWRDATGALRERSFPRYRTHQGPITRSVRWSDGSERWIATALNWDPPTALAQSFLRTKQEDHAGFRQVMGLLRNSSNNTVYADADGTIAYYHGNFIPRRNPTFDFSQPVDGSDPATDWQGLHALEETVQVVDPPIGWLQNCNSSPFTAAGPDSPRREDYPRYMAPDPENYRSLRAVQLLSDSEALTLEGLVELAHDPYLLGLETLVGGVVEAWDGAAAQWPALAGPIAELRAWDRRVALDSVAMSLAHFYGVRFRDEGARPPGLRGVELIEHYGTGSDPARRLELLAATVARLERDFGTWRVPWGEINRFQRLSGAIDLHYDDDAPSLPVPMAWSVWGALAAYRAEPGADTRRIYGRSGNSFVAVVSFGERLRARSILAGGQSGDPGSPHFDDQAPRYVEHAFKPVAFYREDVDRRAVRRYRPGLDP